MLLYAVNFYSIGVRGCFFNSAAIMLCVTFKAELSSMYLQSHAPQRISSFKFKPDYITHLTLANHHGLLYIAAGAAAGSLLICTDP
jgi:hypothetical protein